MNASANPPASPDDTCRHDGWTIDRRRLFLKALGEGHGITAACALVDMSKASVYKLRHRDMGFSVAWQAALRSARSVAFDRLTTLAVRDPTVLEEVTIVTRKSGTVVRRIDTRHALVVLGRLDRRIARLEAAAAMALQDGVIPPTFMDDFADFVDRLTSDAATAGAPQQV
jgi:hypothetical protein